MTKKWRFLTFGLAVILFAAFAYSVWPTPYRPIALSRTIPRVLAAREHRVTGRVELLTREGWRGAAPARMIDRMSDRSSDPLAGYTPDWRTRR